MSRELTSEEKAYVERVKKNRAKARVRPADKPLKGPLSESPVFVEAGGPPTNPFEIEDLEERLAFKEAERKKRRK